MQDITRASSEEVGNGDPSGRYEVVQSRTDHKLDAGSGELPWIFCVKLARGSIQIFPIHLFASTTFTHTSSKLSLKQSQFLPFLQDTKQPLNTHGWGSQWIFLHPTLFIFSNTAHVNMRDYEFWRLKVLKVFVWAVDRTHTC